LYERAPIRNVERLAVVALIVILFNGGLDIGWQRFRQSAFPIVALGVVGTFMTAGIVMVFAHYALGFGWMLAGIAGAALAPTDPAVMYSVLGNHEIGGRSGTTLEGEAGLNDPAGIALMIGMIELATHEGASATVVVREFAVEMSVGVAIGIVGGLALAAILRRLRLPSPTLHPLLALILAGALYGGTSLLHGSGFLAVFLAGLIVGHGTPSSKITITSFSGPLASLAEIAVFVALGLTVALSSLSWRTWFEGLLLMLALAVLARPASVIVTLAGTRFSRAERAFIAWSGLKGAVPILLAAFAVLERVEGANRVYGVVFVVVLLSVIAQGTLVGAVASRLGIPIRARPSAG
jgi:cell volume regulation protein A